MAWLPMKPDPPVTSTVLIAACRVRVIRFPSTESRPPPLAKQSRERSARWETRVQLGGRAFITGTVVRGVFWLRACIVNYRTTETDVDAMVDAVLEAR